VSDTNKQSKQIQAGLHERKREARLYLVLSLLWMAVIFAFSHQAYSGRITEEYLGNANIPIRKLGHVSEFGILSLLYLKTLLCYGSLDSDLPIKVKSTLPMAKFALIALLMTFFYACLDEWHQSFVPGRSSSFTDVLVDTTGILIALGLTLLLTWRSAKKNPNMNSNKNPTKD
jgi:VanZ family protein